MDRENIPTNKCCRHIGKREADAEALHGSVSTTLYNTRISKPVKKVGNTKKGRNDFSDQVGHPDCVSEPVKQCENIPNSNKRNVARTVCDTVVDTHEVEVGFQLKLILMLILMPILLMMLIPMLMLIGMLMMMLMQDCTETITEVCEQTNTYSHTTVSFKSTISKNCNLQ